MNARCGILILAVLGLAAASGAAWSAQPAVGQDYFSVQLLSGKSPAVLQKALAQLAGQPYARIDKRGAEYILRVGFWESRAEAEQAARALLPNFRGAYARIASYRPDAMATSAGPEAGASSAPSPASAVVRPSRVVASTVERPPTKATAEQSPTAVELPSQVKPSTPTQSLVLGQRSQAQPNLLPDPELQGIFPLSPPTEIAPPLREAIAAPRQAVPPPREAITVLRDAVPPPREVAPTPSSEAAPTRRERRASRAQPGAARGPNEVPLWDLLREQRYAELDTELTRMREAYPNWKPPTRLLALRRELDARTRITEAVDTKEWDNVLALAQQYPEQFSCNQIQFLWGLADAYHALGQTAQTIAVYHRIIPACPKPADRIVTLQKAGNVLTAEVYGELLQREARGGRRDAALKSRLDQIVYEFYLRQLLQAIQIKDRPRAVSVLETIDRMPKAQRDARYASSAGWFYLDAGEDETAIKWFEAALNWKPAGEGIEDARHGLALAKFRVSRRDDPKALKLGAKMLDEAEAALARGDPDDARNRALMGEILFARAVNAFERKDFEQSLAYLEQSKAQGKSGRDVGMMRAWIDYQLGEDRKAGDLFVSLYREKPDQESAEGVVLSLSRSDRWGELERLARSGGPLRERAGLPFSQRYYYRKLFVAADAAAPGEFAELDNIATPNITSGLVMRDKAGIDGTSGLRILKVPALEGAMVFGGNHEVRLQVDRLDLASGGLPPATKIGSFPVAGAYVAEPTTHLVNSFEPYLSYQHQGTLTTYGGIGLTPSGAPISRAPVGNLGIIRQAERGNWGVELFSQPMRESMLSYTGIVDPYTGQSWGRVRRTGGLVRGYAVIAENWNLQGKLRAMNVRGENVASNRGEGISLSLARNLTVPGFDYLAVGPDISFDVFEKNLSGFTIGNGGYFSPRRLVSTGLSLNYLTAEARQWSLKGNFSLGYFDKREGESSCFPLGGLPLNPACPNTAASHASGIYYSGQMLGVWQYTDGLQLGGGFMYGRNPQYNDKSAVVFLRYSFYPRAVIMSSDIPDTIFQRLY